VVLAASVVPLLLFIVNLTSYVEVNDSSLIIVSGLIARTVVPIRSIKRIFSRPSFKVGAGKSLAAEFGENGEDQTVLITGIFTPEKTEQALIQELRRRGVNVQVEVTGKV
jgi:hypothetical protein